MRVGDRVLERAATSLAGDGVGVAGIGLEGERGWGRTGVAVAGVGGGGTTVAGTANEESRAGRCEGGNRRFHRGLGQNAGTRLLRPSIACVSISGILPDVLIFEVLTSDL